MRRALPILSALAAVLVLAGCADPTLQPGGGGGAPTSAPSTTAPATSIPKPVPTKPVPTKQAGGEVTIDGVVEAGVEPGCTVLRSGETSYLILGENVPMGVPVRVTGVLQPGVLTTCQQGTPIRVTKVQRR